MKANDHTGRRFGALVAQGRDGVIGKRSAWICKCDCGNVIRAAAANLVRGKYQSCGCMRLKLIGDKKVKHGHRRDGAYPREYEIWCGMKARCGRRSHRAYARYGGRGIVVCERWQTDFASFLADMGPCPPEYTIDRIDNDRGYSPDNCRWVSRDEQARNTRKTRRITVNGETLCMAQWAQSLGLNNGTLSCRLAKGRRIEDMLLEKAS